MRGTPWQTHRPTTRLGEHTNEVVSDIDEIKGAVATTTGRPGPLPLEGIRVADFPRAFAGPLTTMCLAFFRAEVIGIESADLENLLFRTSIEISTVAQSTPEALRSSN